MNIVAIEEFIEHSIPVERELTDLIFENPEKPDLSQLRSNRKPAGGKGRGGKSSGPSKSSSSRPVADKRRLSKSADPKSANPKGAYRGDKEGGKPAKTKADVPTTPHSESPEALDATRLAKLEERGEQVVAPPRIPLRGKMGREIPAIG